jgi:hypothetical protein
LEKQFTPQGLCHEDHKWRVETRVQALLETVYNNPHALFKSKRLSTNIKLTLHKAFIRSVMTYASPAWEFVADTRLLKLQRLQNKVLRTIGNFSRHTPVCELHKALSIPYIYDYITKLCRKEAQLIQKSW